MELMSTKVFICWSGELSRKLAEALRNWLPSALQYVKPYFSPDDTEKGTRWNSEISQELETSAVGIICLTQENIEKPWILFESGALSKSLDHSRVCTLLFDLDASDMKGPLICFQATKFTREDFKRLLNTINNASGESRLESTVLDQVFAKWWPDLEKQIAEILGGHEKSRVRKVRPDRDILEEILELTRMNTGRVQRPARFSQAGVLELVQGLTEVFCTARPECTWIVNVYDRIDRPLRHICLEAGAPELYETFRMRVAEMRAARKAPKEETAEQPHAADAAMRRR